MSILDYCLLLKTLLEKSGEEHWANVFDKMAFNLQENEINREMINDLLKMYGGMGSFNDLILYLRGVPEVEQNNYLEYLRTGLYKELIKYLS